MKPRPYSLNHRSIQPRHLILSHAVLTAALILFLAACSSLTASRSKEKAESPDLAATAEARIVLSKLRSHNANLTNFKGRGKIKVWQKGKLKINERIVWIASERTKLSIVLLIGGYPAVKMASDGNWFYYYEAAQGNPIYKKIAASNANLKRVISVSIETADISNLLAGRVPIREYHSAVLEEQPAEQGYILVLKKRWWGVRQKIFIDKSKAQAQQVEFYNRSGALIYRARFDEMQVIDGYQVPARLRIASGKDAAVELDIKNFWADVAVNSSMFVLKPPAEN